MPKIQIENFCGQKQSKSDNNLFITKKRKCSIDASLSKKVNSKKKIIRKHTPLGEITKKFFDYIIIHRLKTFDIKKASEDLNIPKRRIYDITNVLEGK